MSVPASQSANLPALVAALANEELGLFGDQLGENSVWRRISSLSAEEARTFVRLAIPWLSEPHQTSGWYRPRVLLQQVVLGILRRKLPFDRDDVLGLLALSMNQSAPYRLAVGGIVRVLEYYLNEHPLTPDIQDATRQVVRLWGIGYTSPVTSRLVARLRELGGFSDDALPLVAGEAWSDAAISDLQALTAETRSAWGALLQHCSSAGTGKPSAKWLKQAGQCVDVIKRDSYNALALKWFALFDKPPTQQGVQRAGQPNVRNADVLKGLVWTCALHADPALARGIVTLAVSAYRKIPGVGPRSALIGNACVWMLGQMSGEESIRQLVVLRTRVKQPAAQKQIEKAIAAAAARLGIERGVVEELTAPTYGLDEVGKGREAFGEHTAELTVTGTAAVELRWVTPAGKTQSSVPKGVQENHADQLKALKQAVKDIVKMLPAQRDRLESLYLAPQGWEFPTWRARYLDHPLVGTLARRLIWQFTSGERSTSAIWFDGQLVDQRGQALQGLNDAARVSLWHPLTETAETVFGWRRWLSEHLVQQPFKQAHREIYLLTDAERQTRVYSNRFAAHILRQHQFNALCAARGWTNKLRLMVDVNYPPATRQLPVHGMRAEFWIEGAGSEYGTDTNQGGTYLYVATDQVRFYQLGTAAHYAHASGGGYSTRRDLADDAPLPLEEIPPLVFSEVMRDVDLFVGVASVGNDPTWTDGRSEGPQLDYWQEYSFGELSETANTRREILEALIPRLKIAPRCQFSNRFLIVRGDLRTYKIHLGSGNILMEPNDQYLCIVPKQGTAAAPGGKVFLPFEGDHLLSVILSKAFLLADDRKIADPLIAQQLRR